MGIRTVRLDQDAEATLAEVRKRTGLSVSEVLKRGLAAYAAVTREQAAETPYRIYRRLDVGPGGYAVAPARRAKAAVIEVIRSRHRR